jgi:hypothetical protein
VAAPLDRQLGAPPDEVGEAAEGDADELDLSDLEGALEATVVGPQAVAQTMANATAAARSIPMPDFIRISKEAG